MSRSTRTSAAILPLALLLGAHAPAALAQQAVGTELLLSDDADDSQVIKWGAYLDFAHADIEHYQGIKLERARFAPVGGAFRSHDRIYYRFADTAGDWKWNGALGTDGDTWLGGASVYKDVPRRQEYFLEREVVETPIGLERGLRSTFVGAAYDLPLDDNNTVTALVGVQDFSGDNVRSHLRARYVHVLKPEWGLSAQLRARYFHNSVPHEFDYYAPRAYTEVIPMLQLRRFRGGWMYQVAAGYGRAHDSDSGWRDARLLEAAITSPKTGEWFFKLNLTHSNMPTNAETGSGEGYDYSMLMLQLSRRF